MKLTLTLVAALIVAALIAAPALGKGIVVEQVAAGEEPTTIVLVTADIPEEVQAKIVAGLSSSKGTLADDEVTDDLGAVVPLATTLSTRPGGRDDVIEQELYPFAAGGPLVFTPKGQKRHVIGKSKTIPVKSGWKPYPPSATELLLAEGVGADVLSAPAPGEERGTPFAAWAVLIGSIVLAAIMFTVGIRRSSA